MIAENEIRQHHSTFSNRLMKGFKVELKSSVAIIMKEVEGKPCYLLARSTDTDDRQGKLCFVGGGIDKGESPMQAAIREAYEESGLICKPLSLMTFTHPIKPTVGFHLLSCDCNNEVKLNEEFSEYKWQPINEKMPDDMMELNKKIMVVISKSFRQ